jgi:hypothetical protein
MMEAARTSETSVDNYFTRQYIPEDNSELKNLNILLFYLHGFRLSNCVYFGGSFMKIFVHVYLILLTDSTYQRDITHFILVKGSPQSECI